VPISRRSLRLAPIEVRDFAYRELIELSPARSSFDILSGSEGLYSRKIFDISNYGMLPGSVAERTTLASRISRLISEKFPNFASTRQFVAQGIPGFWMARNDSVRLGGEHDLTVSLLLIPCLDRNGMIQACQLRAIGEFPNGYSRYFWLSSTDKCNGSSPGSPLHYATFDTAIPRPLLMTEGPLKAETAKSFFPNHDIVASSGVSCSHEEIVSAARNRAIEIAFDSDCVRNPHVARAVAKLLCLRLTDQKAQAYRNHTSILVWDETAKGLDEALIEALPIRSVSVLDWFGMLTSDCKSVVASALEHLPILHPAGTRSFRAKEIERRIGEEKRLVQVRHVRYETAFA